MSQMGFSAAKYIEEQSKYILERIEDGGGNRLYLEFGGKLVQDKHAMRVLPGYDENAKITNYEKLMEQVITELAKYGFVLSAANTDMSGGESGKSDRYVTLIHESGIKIVIENNHTKYLWVYFCDLETPM